MALTNTINGTYTLDESSGIQVGADGTPSGSARADSDITLSGAAGTLQGDDSAFYDMLFGAGPGQLSMPTTFSADVGAAKSATNIINVTDSSGGNISSIGLTDANGGSFLEADLVDSGLKTADGDHTIYLVSASLGGVDNQVVLGKYDSDGDGSLDKLAFAVAMKPNGALDSNVDVQLFSVTFTALESPTPGSTAAAYDEAVDLLQNVYIHSTGELHINFDSMPSGANLFNDAAESASGGGIIVFGMNPVVGSDGKYTNASDYISTSQGGTGATIGVNSQMFDPLEGAYFTYCNDIDDNYLSGLKPKGLSATEADYQQNMKYADLIEAHTASVHISQIQNANNPAGVTITAYELNSAFQGADLLSHRGGQNSGGSAVAIDAVTIWDSTHTNVLESYANGAEAGSSAAINISIDGNGVATVSGLSVSNIVEWHTATDHNQVLIQNTSPAGKFDIGGFDIREGSSDTDSLAGHAFVEDDGPSFSAPIADGYVHFAAGAQDSDTLNTVTGSDTPGSSAITAFTTAVSLTGVDLIADDPNDDGQLIQYFQDKGGTAGVYDAGTDVLYYTMDLTTTPGSWTFKVLAAPDAPPLIFDFDNLPSGQNLFGTVADSPDGIGIFVAGKVTALKNDGTFTNASNTINTSQGGIGATIGVNNQMFDAGEGAYFTLVNNIDDRYISGIPGGLDQGEADDADNMLYGTLKDVSESFLGISQLQGNSLATMKLTAIDLDANPQGRALLSSSGGDAAGEPPADDIINITRVVVKSSAGTVLEDSSLPGGQNADITIDLGGLTAVIAGLHAGDQVEWFTAGGAGGTFNQVLVEGVAGKFDVGFFGINEPQLNPDRVLDFTVTHTDADGDTASDSFQVAVDAVPFYA